MKKKPVLQEIEKEVVLEAEKLVESESDNLTEADLEEAGKLPVEDEEDEKDDDMKDEGCSSGKKQYKMKKEQLEALDNLVKEQKDLPTELAEKLVTIFEVMVSEVVNDIVEEEVKSLQEASEKSLEEALKVLAEGMNQFLDQQIDEWSKTNEVALIAEAKVQKAEAMLEGLKTLFVENSVSYEQKTIDLVAEAEKKVAELDKQLNETIESNISLKKKIDEQQKQFIFNEVTSGMALTEAEKLAGLISEGENLSVEKYETKLKTLKESFFVEKQSNHQKTNVINSSTSTVNLSVYDKIFGC